MVTGELRHKRVAFYGRFSSEMQSESSADDQLRVCMRYVEERGGTIDLKLVFSDPAITGSTDQRPGLIALRGAVKARRVDVVVVEDLSRLSRNEGDVQRLKDTFAFYDVRLIGIGDGIDTDHASAGMMMAVHGHFAAEYIKALSYRTLRGMEGRFALGGATGGVPFGYETRRADPESPAIVHVHEGNAAIVRNIFALYANGNGPARICEVLNAAGTPTPRRRRSTRMDGWIYSAVREILRNPKYTGDWTFKRSLWMRDPETRRKKQRPRADGQVMREQREHLRIVDQRTWDVVQARFRTNKVRELAPQAANYLLTGVLFCGHCGARMSVIGGKDRRYGCTAAHKHRLCPMRKSVREDVTRTRILEVFRDRFFSPGALSYARRRYIEKLRKLQAGQVKTIDGAEKKLRKLRDELANLTQALRLGFSAALTSELHRVERDITAAEIEAQAAAALKEAPPQIPTDAELIRRVLEIDRLTETDPHGAREVIRSWLGPEGIKLHLVGDDYVARFEAYPMAILLQSKRPTDTPEGAGRPVYTDLVAGAQYAGGILRLGEPVSCEVSLAGGVRR